MTKGLIALIALALIGCFGPRKPLKFYLHYFIFLGICFLPIEMFLAKTVGADPVEMLLLRSSWSYLNVIVAINYLVIAVGIVGVLRNFLSGQAGTNQQSTKE